MSSPAPGPPRQGPADELGAGGPPDSGTQEVGLLNPSQLAPGTTWGGPPLSCVHAFPAFSLLVSCEPLRAVCTPSVPAFTFASFSFFFVPF